jgi:hypothetical protein
MIHNAISYELTKERFGYSPDELSFGSHKLCIAICEFCKNSFSVRLLNLYRNKRSVSCIKCTGVSRAFLHQNYEVDKHKFWLSKKRSTPVQFIDIDETKNRFGYIPNIFAKTSKNIVAICEFCKSKFETTLISFHSNEKYSCCFNCSPIAAAFSKQNLILDKHEYFNFVNEERCRKINMINISISSPGSDKQIEVICDFCQKKFNKLIKYINYDRKSIICGKCAGTAAAFFAQNLVQDKHEFWLDKNKSIDQQLVYADQTFQSFGYTPNDLSSGSHKSIIVPCCFCKAPTKTVFNYFVRRGYKKTCKLCKYKKNKETIFNKYGVASVLEIPSVQDKLSNPLTERIVESILRDKFKVKYIRNYSVPIIDDRIYTFDFYVPSANLLIECQGDYFHDFKKNGYSGTPKDRAKASFIENNTNYHLVWIWEHELHIGRINKILGYHILGETESIIEIPYLKDLSFKRINDSDAHSFLSQYHYLGNLGSISVCYGGFINNILVCVATFGGTTRQNTFKKVSTEIKQSFGSKQLKELRRFCIRPNVNAKRMASFAIRNFVSLYKIDFPETRAIISFADSSVGDTGSIYKYSGWKQLKNTKCSYHYFDPKTCKMIHKKTLWDLACSVKMKESEFALSIGLHKVEELPKFMWIKVF